MFCLTKSLLGVYRAAVNLVVLAELEIHRGNVPNIYASFEISS
jgi:hypothetical protein